MKIKRLYINNYKSLVDFELVEPNPFSVFVGPNAAGKSNIFEALEFLSYDFSNTNWLSNIFGTPSSFLNKRIFSKTENRNNNHIYFEILYDRLMVYRNLVCHKKNDKWELHEIDFEDDNYENLVVFQIPYQAFSRIFVGNEAINKFNINDSESLRIDAANLEAVLHRILQDEIKREEIMEWVDMLIPGLEKIDVVKSEYSDDYILRVFEKHMDEPIRKNLISNGTYNILALLTAVYQSDEPQFLCIEEPENGLNPYVIRELVDFFRQMCEEKGHYIWLNTHSATLVKELKPEELILINKINGITKAKQLDKDLEFKSMPLDEAWLTNTLGGGIPW